MKMMGQKRQIDLGNGETMEVHVDQKGNVKSANVGNQKLQIKKASKGSLTFNGQKVIYASPGAEIITKINPFCYWRQNPDGTWTYICYP
ncbi:MAG: hypothetical protein HY896_01190 [Deltaproteobacteria bacterium]|nr:hypothetical protein [Deltaproteobacteria bacterium]